MGETTTRALTQLLSFVVDNRGRTCPTAESGFPLIATNCLKRGSREPVFEKVRYVDARTYSTWFRAHPVPGDVLFVCKGSPGRVALVADPVTYCIAQDMVALRPDHSRVDSRYLYYRLMADDVQASIENMHVGTMIPHFKRGDFGKLQFTVHDDLAEQRAIAEVLGALDDKIAANESSSRTALDLADATFIMVRRAADGIESSYEDAAAVGGGGTPKTAVESYWGGDIPWTTPTDVTALNVPYLDTTARLITAEGLSNCSSPLYPAGSILMTSRATIGAFAVSQSPVAVNQGFIVVNAKDPILQWWIFHDMRARVREFLSYANGATFLELSRGKFKKLSVELPDSRQAASFAAAVGPLHAVAAHAQRESSKLTRTRDELLPLLMSGKLRVRDAEAVVSDVV